MEPENRNPTGKDEKQMVSRRIERLSLHLRPPCNDSQLLWMAACAGKGQLEVKKEKLALYTRQKHRDLQEAVFAYFKSRPELQTPVELSTDEHRELCWRQLIGLVREAGIRPFRYVSEDPAKYFAILEAAGSIDMSLGIKMGVQYR